MTKKSKSDASVSAPKRSLLSRLTYNLPAKIICIIFAIVLWIYVTDVENPNYEITLTDIPVSIVGTEDVEIDSGLVVYSGYDETVDVTLRGRKNLLSGVTADDVSVTADITSATEAGEYEIELKITPPDDSEVVSASADSVTVALDKKSSIDVDIKVVYSGLTLEKTSTTTYSLGDPVLSVSSVTVTGPSRYLEEISYGQVTLPDLGRVTGTLTVYGTILLIDSDGAIVSNPYVSMSQTDVSVTIPVYAEKTVTLSVETVYGYFNDDNCIITIEPESVLVKGDAATVDSLDTITVTTLDEKTITDNMTLSVALPIPDGAENLDGVEFVDITVELVNVATRTFIISNSSITAENPNSVTYDVADGYTTVTLRGSTQEIYSVDEDDIALMIDLSAYSTQELTSFLSVTVVVNGYESVYELGSYSVSVDINPTAETTDAEGTSDGSE
ncbi:MAG: hypothetical protein LUI15_08275 [Firmicutes bacterium]|nr:hypothetical protein [Bacillota bacterium]